MKKVADILSKTGKWLLVFGFVFSQVSFPLEVLADELTDDENTYEDVNVVVENDDINTDDSFSNIQISGPVIKINGEEVTEYTVSDDNTEVTITLENQDVNDEVKIDFSNKLYGTYQYTFNSVEKTVTINYVGNNADLLKQYVNEEVSTKNIVCDEVNCVVSGFGVGEVKVADITVGYYDLEAFNNGYNANVGVTNSEEMLLGTDIVLNGYELVIEANQVEEEIGNGVLVNTTPESMYTINRVGDVYVPSDGLIDTNDQEAVLDDIINENDITDLNDINGDGVLDILDATHSTFIEGDIVEGEITDVLTNTLVVDTENEEILVGDNVEVKLFVSGFDKLSLYGIEGLLTYDKSILKLVGASLYEDTLEETENLGELNLENGKFAYVLGSSFNDSEVALLTLQFEVLAEGTTEVSISNILESYGEVFEVVNDTVSVSLTVAEEGIGGDVEIPGDSTEDDTTTDNTEEDTKTETTEKTEDTIVVVKPVVKSSDYYIKNLVIDGYEIDFDMYTYEYSIKVGADVTELDINVLLNNSNSIYYVEGNENFVSGENLVYLVVKAENGSTKTYTIRVEKEKEVVAEEEEEIDEDEIEEEASNTSKVIIIILIILVIIGLIYVIFKDDEEDTKETKKTSQPEKVKSDEVRIEKVKTTPKKTVEVKKSTSNNKNTKKTKKK